MTAALLNLLIAYHLAFPWPECTKLFTFCYPCCVNFCSTRASQYIQPIHFTDKLWNIIFFPFHLFIILLFSYNLYSFKRWGIWKHLRTNKFPIDILLGTLLLQFCKKKLHLGAFPIFYNSWPICVSYEIMQNRIVFKQNNLFYSLKSMIRNE